MNAKSLRFCSLFTLKDIPTRYRLLEVFHNKVRFIPPASFLFLPLFSLHFLSLLTPLHYFFPLPFFFLLVLELEPKAPFMVDQLSGTRQHPQPLNLCTHMENILPIHQEADPVLSIFSLWLLSSSPLSLEFCA